MSGHAQAAVPSQQPYIMRLQRSVSHTLSTNHFQSLNLHKNSHHLKKSTYRQQQSEGSRNLPSCLRTGWGSNNPRNNKCTCSNHTSRRLAFNTCASKKEKATTNMIFKCLNANC
ncbi:hypothetical protein FHG87_017857 [Trinorchestia longiramus]|nr:hypothetical protein FHG87_017857 [Trinorchestia longiramus]